MLTKLLIFGLLVEILLAQESQKVMIKNKKTGFVFDGDTDHVTIGPWMGKKSQLWVFKPAKTIGTFIISNVENGKVADVHPGTHEIITWKELGATNQQWYVTPEQTLVVARYSNQVLAQNETDELVLDTTKRSDDSDKWLFVEPFCPVE